MSEFHRMVTYLYLYEGNHKTRNVGYAKIEKKDAQCRVEIHLKNTGLMEHDIPVYFYARNDIGFPGILLGSVTFARGIGEFTNLFDSVGISNTDYNISSIKGIFMPISEHQMILSQWDDDSFDRASFYSADASAPGTSAPPEENTVSSTTSDAHENSVLHTTSDASKSSALYTASDVGENSALHTVSDVEENLSLHTVSNVEETVDLKSAEAAPDLLGNTSASESGPAAKLKIPQSHATRWRFIMENFPPIAPFPSETSFEWVRLELKDLRLLPKSYWHLNNNSFLLHGFFNYHHLLLGKKKDTQPCEWLLGVPGVFQNPERVMATLFGFPDFHSTSEANTKTGQFGYWLRPLE